MFNYVIVSNADENCGDGITTQYYRFRDENNFPELIIVATGEHESLHYEKQQAETFLGALPSEEADIELLEGGWKKILPDNTFRTENVKKFCMQSEGYELVVYYLQDKNLQELREWAEEELPDNV